MADDDDGIQPQEGGFVPPRRVVAVAVSGRRESKYIVKWAMEKFAPEGDVLLKLLHVRPVITAVPTPMGNLIPISQVREDVAAAYKQEIEWQKKQMLLPYKKLCGRKKIEADILVIESDDVANALAEEVTKSAVQKLVIGAATPGLFTRKVKKNNLSSRISACVPSFCTVYAVSKGKLSSLRPSDLDSNASVKDDSSATSSSSDSLTSGSLRDNSSVASYSHFHSPFLPILLKKKPASTEATHSRHQSAIPKELDPMDAFFTSSSESATHLTRTVSTSSFTTDAQSWMSDHVSTSNVLTAFPSPASQVSVNLELEKLRIELRHARGMYAVARSETVEASEKLNNLKEKWLEESMKLKDVKVREERVEELAREEQERYKAAKKEAVVVKACAEREASQKKDAELKALRDMKEKETLENALLGHTLPYRIFNWEEIASATASFSESHRIGEGAYGTVYRCSLQHTEVAVKVLHGLERRKLKQFEQELDILSKVRHPHLLLLIGACPDHGCLIYEHMENGSLEDRLLRKNGSPPIPWHARFCIAWEVASALSFLHNSKPNPIVHRDLKPANILLNHSFVSKIGDVGLSTALSDDPSKEMGPVGTLPYMDPEYQRTGTVSPKSDVYAFGVVILQLLTARPAIALTDAVETAIDDASLPDILDKQAGDWPDKETKELATLGLRCAELRRKDRPDLNNEVLPVLEKLKEMADEFRRSSSTARTAPPNHFLCPILKDVMEDPCVAADGYTYDRRRGIEKWLKEKDKSPMTNLPLPHKDLIPNHTLRSAIMEWNSIRG